MLRVVMSRDGTRERTGDGNTGTREKQLVTWSLLGMETGIELLTSSSYSFKLPVTGQLTS